jgi:hypothetical protein
MQVKSNLQYQESIRSPEQERILEYLKGLNDESTGKMTAIFAAGLVVTVLLVGFMIGHEISRRHKQEQLPDKSKQSPQQEQLLNESNQSSKIILPFSLLLVHL